MKYAKDLYDYLSYLIQDTQGSEWSQWRKMYALNQSYSNVVNRVIQAFENWFDSYTTLTPGTVRDNATPYSFPSMPKVLKILSITDSDGRPLEPIHVQQREYSSLDTQARGAQVGYWLGHDKLWVNSASYDDTLSFYYIRRPIHLLCGTASAGSSTTMTLGAGSSSVQKPDPQDDYYNDMYFYIHTGTRAGERVQATDYVGSTRVLTITYSGAPSTDSEYCTESELPDGHNEIIPVGAAIRALSMSTGITTKLEEMWKLYGKLEMDLLDFLQNRQIQVPRRVVVRDYND